MREATLTDAFQLWRDAGPDARLLAGGQSLLATLAFLGLRWRFKGPIKIGDTIKVRMKVTSKKEVSKPDRGIVTVQRQILNQRGELVQEGDTELMIERRK